MTAAAHADEPPWQAPACESLQAHAPEFIALMRALYNAGLIDGARSLEYAKTPDGEWGEPPEHRPPGLCREPVKTPAATPTVPPWDYNPPFVRR